MVRILDHGLVSNRKTQKLAYSLASSFEQVKTEPEHVRNTGTLTHTHTREPQETRMREEERG